MPSKVKGEEERESGEGKEEGNRGGGEGEGNRGGGERGREQRGRGGRKGVCSHTRNQCVLLCGIIHLVDLNGVTSSGHIHQCIS